MKYQKQELQYFPVNSKDKIIEVDFKEIKSTPINSCKRETKDDNGLFIFGIKLKNNVISTILYILAVLYYIVGVDGTSWNTVWERCSISLLIMAVGVIIMLIDNLKRVS